MRDFLNLGWKITFLDTFRRVIGGSGDAIQVFYYLQQIGYVYLQKRESFDFDFEKYLKAKGYF
ncbi:hypothetical protein M3O96_19785 [Aquiflexum sp. TKW24L]|uniref:hypothetical protein n=1 Tax=Aquiflexum sp. TKW24L TaxID=2942212 RepID=UPI0020BFD3CF|nr:hypothetical protein [Aquiflexum sp. TKW24L]MCL6261351.1 hypothetical protein [Aquiflexum sp. TKW24L]